MRAIVARLAIGAAMALAAASATAGDWGDLATISSTLGVNANRLCLGEGLRVSDIGCPNYAPYVTSAGRVGIGIQSPTATLQVSGTFTVSNTAQVITPTLYVNSSNNVGIGTMYPSSTLHVAGGTILGGITGSSYTDIVARGDIDGIRLYSGNNPAGGSINPPGIGFYPSIGTPFASPTFRISASSTIFTLSSPAYDTTWIDNNPPGSTPATGVRQLALYQLPMIYSGVLAVGHDSYGGGTGTGGILRSGQVNARVLAFWRGWILMLRC